MRQQRLLERLRAGETLLGLAVSYPAPGLVEVMCTDWDFTWIDAQHGQFTYSDAINCVRAADMLDIESILRVPSYDPDAMGPYADMAPSSIMVPMVDTAAQAAQVVGALRFPPLGNRSFGGRRAVDLYGGAYTQLESPVVLAQIETPTAIDNASQIIATPGIDALFFGADDVKLRMDLPMSESVATNEELRSALESIGRAAREAGKHIGCVAPDQASRQVAVEVGCQIIACGSESLILRRRGGEILSESKALLEGRVNPQASNPKS